MADDPALDAMHRIEHALARIEASMATPAPVGGLGDAYVALEEQHARLRDGLRSVIDGLDRMIEGGAA